MTVPVDGDEAMSAAQPAPRLPIRLTIPAETRLLRLARMTAATVAADMGFTLQDIEDVRVAVDELAAVLIDSGHDGAVLDLCFGPEDDTLVVVGEVLGGEPVTDMHPVARELLDLVADEYSISVGGGGGSSFRVVKRRRGPEE